MPSLLATPDAQTRQRARRERTRLLAALPLALATQALLVGLFLGVSALKSPEVPRPESRPVSLKPMSATRWAANRGNPGRNVPERRERPAELHPKGQVVDVAPGNNRPPEESKYLAETNNTVTHETRAREQTQTWSRATPKNQANPTAMPSAKGRAAPQAETAQAPSLLASALGRRPWSLMSDHASAGSNEATPTTDEPAPIGTEQGTQASGGDTTEGGGAPNDNLNNLPAGEGTFLNTREWKYAAFFNRVKQAVSARWDPNGRLRARNREVGPDDHVTVLYVTLRPDGSLAEAVVAKSSGIDELDQEAVKAFEKDQPFANPPSALVEHDFIRFAYGFTLTNGEFGGGGTPRWMPGPMHR